jgi:hypothetical protein
MAGGKPCSGPSAGGMRLHRSGLSACGMRLHRSGLSAGGMHLHRSGPSAGGMRLHRSGLSAGGMRLHRSGVCAWLQGRRAKLGSRGWKEVVDRHGCLLWLVVLNEHVCCVPT